jgi:hypothetical protein
MCILTKLRAGILAGIVGLVTAVAVYAADLHDIEVEREDDVYKLRSTAWFDSNPDALYEVLTNYELFRYFTSAIIESHNLTPDDKGRPRYFTRMEGCVLLWCKSFIRAGHLELQPISEVIAIADPQESDFKHSYERWQLVPHDGGTLLIYEFEMVPDFWVPPVIGPFMIRRALKAGGEGAINRIERIAVAQYEH